MEGEAQAVDNTQIMQIKHCLSLYLHPLTHLELQEKTRSN